MSDWMNKVQTPTSSRISRNELENRIKAFEGTSFALSYDTNKLSLFQGGNPVRDIYLDKALRKLQIVVSPSEKEHAMRACQSSGGIGETMVHNSNMRRFPERTHTGAGPTRVGLPIRFETVGALHDFLIAFDSDR